MKIFYTKSDLIFIMTNLIKKTIIEKISTSEIKIHKVENPVINPNIKNLALQEIELNEKNYLELIKVFKKINTYQKNVKLIIIGSGELKNEILYYLKVNKIRNIFLLGFKNNPFKYMFQSNLYVSSSLWEEPGHTILEAGYLNKLVLSSNCKNGPREILEHGINSLVYQLNDLYDLEQKILCALKMKETEKKIFK